VCLGVAEYRFGAGKAGLVGDVERALAAARDRFQRVGGSQVGYYHELGTGAPLDAAA